MILLKYGKRHVGSLFSGFYALLYTYSCYILVSAAIAELVLVMLKFERDRNFSRFEKGWSIYCFFIAVGFLGLTQILLSIILCLPLKDNSSSPSQNFIREPYVSDSRQNQPWSSLEMQQGSMNMSYQEQKY